jgi:hypothetical protein
MLILALKNIFATLTQILVKLKINFEIFTSPTKTTLMHNIKPTLIAIAIASIFCSCASSYKAIHPQNLNYTSSDSTETFAYKYGILSQARNKKYAKKEGKNHISVIAIRINNNTMHTLKYGYNYKIYSGNQELEILPITTVTKSIKQTTPTYLLYLLLTPATFNVSTATSKSSTPIGLIIGPGLAALNVAIAAKANSNFKKEMEAYSIFDKEIKTGDTVYGIIAIQNTDLLPLSIRIINN